VAAAACSLLPTILAPGLRPPLHLIERVWRYVKQKLACHRWWNDLDRLIQATETLLAGLEFHVQSTDGPAFRSAQNLCESAYCLYKKIAYEYSSQDS
jgi:uncharacterized protein YndB with AHSA1/START domain